MRGLPSIVGGRYEVLRLLDEGGHALVYLARDTRLGRLVALKTLKPEHLGDAALVARLEQEVRLVAQLSHPNLVTLHDWLSDDSGQYAVLEYVPGENLKAYLRRRGRLAPDEAIAVVRQVLAALVAVHGAGIVHRDVKPQNVLLVRDADEAAGEKGREQPSAHLAPLVKLTDLGIARIAVDPGPTPLGATVGTPQYLSPEQAMGRPATPVSDVYSVGALLYELLVGSPPFGGETPLAIVHQQAYAAPRPPRDIVPVLSPELERVVLRSLAKDPAQRYPTAAAFAAALDGLASTASGRTATLTTLPTVSPGPRAWLSRARGRLLPLLSAALVLAFALSGLLGWLSSASDGPSAARPTATGLPTRTTVVLAAATPTLRPTLTSTSTPLPPTATPTPRPTQTPTPPTPTATATPTPSPTPVPTPTQTVVRVTVQPLSTAMEDIGVLQRDGGRVTIQVSVKGGRNDVVLSVYRGDVVVRGPTRVEGQGQVDIQLAAAGDYRVLLDNRFSILTSKQVTITSRILEPR